MGIRSLVFNLPLCGGGESKKQCTIERAAAGTNTQLVLLVSLTHTLSRAKYLCYIPLGCSTSFALGTYNIDAHMNRTNKYTQRWVCECVPNRFSAKNNNFKGQRSLLIKFYLREG